MLSREENDIYTRVGPGTPAGEMLRRYWHPIGFAAELKKRPIKKRLFGEDLVLFRDDVGKLGLLTLRCAHRGTSLEFGHIEDGGLRCCYHGWLYNVEGKILEQPGEPPESNFKERVRQRAYKVQELGGVIFAYLGPDPAPLLPRWDVLVRDDGVRARQGRLIHCNFFQMIENSVDQHHLKWLHRTSKTPAWDDGEINPQPFEHGIVNTYTRRVDGKKWAHVNYFVFPTMNKTGNVEEGHPTEHRASSAGEVMRWRVPVDDSSSMHFTVEFGASCDGQTVKIMEDRAEQGIVDTKQGVYRWDDSIGWFARADQDRAAQESQGTIYDRSTEHLAATDKGVILLRRLYRESIEAVKNGRDPLGVVRDAAKNEIIRLVPHEDLLD
ncbi:MAG TPA: Rieske 2Fe-2S domain-containing protein [Candidatus Binatia bacterium]|nr:Rieske 2Fe-2S domain-containing protein [Candidatus Binatia bacterium]